MNRNTSRQIDEVKARLDQRDGPGAARALKQLAAGDPQAAEQMRDSLIATGLSRLVARGVGKKR